MENIDNNNAESQEMSKKPWVTPDLIDLDVPRNTAQGLNTAPDGHTGTSLS